jgi:preprotein translocase subunit SecE
MRISKTVLIVLSIAGLGGFLYGFDLGVIAGALVFMKKDLAIS